jgi:hypothetical protein
VKGKIEVEKENSNLGTNFRKEERKQIYEEKEEAVRNEKKGTKWKKKEVTQEILEKNDPSEVKKKKIKWKDKGYYYEVKVKCKKKPPDNVHNIIIIKRSESEKDHSIIKAAKEVQIEEFKEENVVIKLGGRNDDLPNPGFGIARV